MSRVASHSLRLRIHKGYSADRASKFSLNVEFSVEPGFTILFGASGAGKTTLLDCVAGLVRPDSGQITIGETVLFDSGIQVNLAPNCRAVGYVMQSLALFPHMTVHENVQYGLEGLPRSERQARSSAILDSFNIGALARRRPAELSGGERQRVALARTLVTQPRALLLDEPLSALDAATKAQLLVDLRTWNRSHQIPILYVTHQREEVFALGERAVVLDSGRIVAQGTPHQVLHRPEAESVAQLAGFENILDAVFISAHPEQGTMTCHIANSRLHLEAPLTRVNPGASLRVGIRAGDILLASDPPRGLSARNVFAGTITSLQRKDVMVTARVDCGTDLEVHVTPGAVHDLHLAAGRQVWVVLKTYSCQVLQDERSRDNEKG